MEPPALASVPSIVAPRRRHGQPVRSRWFRGVLWTPLRVVLVYAAVGGLWILFSDRALGLLVPDPADRDQLQTIKGWFYVVATSGLLYVLIRRSHSRLRSFGVEIRAAVESMVDGVLITDKAGVLEANRAALALLGVTSKAEVLGTLEEFARRFQPRNTDGSPISLSELTSARAFLGERTTREALLRRADGREAVLSISAAPFTAANAPAGATLSIVVFRDVSAAHHLEAMRDEFLATAAHELKTPLAVVKAYAQLVQRRAPAEAPALTVVQRQVDRMTRLVQHLLDASRLRLDLGDGAPERFDLARLTAEVVERLRSADGAHTFRCVAPGPVPVEGDRDRIARVVQSLLDNAVRFSPGGGAVEARVLVDGREARVSVADHGVGIPVERQGRIFERYYRAHAGTPEDYGGLGLSLDLSREIVTRHGGRIWFESTPGQGSTFHFSLPAAPEGRA